MRKKVTLKKLIKSSFNKIMNGEWYDFGNYIVTELTNILFVKINSNNQILICPLCSYSGPNFIHLGNQSGITWNSACPNCDSRSRHRGLIFLYHSVLQTKTKIRILHFAPESFFRDYIKDYKSNKYFTTDYNMLDVDFPNEDIQNLKFDNFSFDLVLANHVLEHIPDDKKALLEIARILRPGGMAILTVPGDWRRPNTIFYPNLDYNGHYRDYGLDILEMMGAIFSEVTISNLFRFNCNKHAIKNDEKAFLCIK